MYRSNVMSASLIQTVLYVVAKIISNDLKNLFDIKIYQYDWYFLVVVPSIAFYSFAYYLLLVIRKKKSDKIY